MNKDIRLSVNFWQHPKAKKTVKRLGLEGIRSLQILWLWAAVNRPDGVLSGMDWEDIELAADWQGEERAFFECCLSAEGASMWIDEAEDGYILHDWTERNPWAADADDRSDRARFSRLATVNRQAFDELKAAGVNSIPKEDYDRLTNVNVSPTNAQRPADGRSTNAGVSSTNGQRPAGVSSTNGQRPAGVSPTPSPSPALKIKDLNTPPLPPVGGQSGSGGAFAPEQQEQEQAPVPTAVPVPEPVPVLEANFPDIEFLQVVDAYPPHRRDVQAAWIEWKSAKKSRKSIGLTRFFAGLTAWTESEQWTKDCGKFVPNLSNFIRKVQWMDNPPPARAAPDPYAGKNLEQILKIQDEERKRVWGAA